MADPFDLLRALAALGVPFALYGTSGLALLHPHVRRALPDAERDLDIVLVPGIEHLRAVVRFAEAHSAAVTCWGTPFDHSWTEREIAGKYYVRAVFSGPKWETQLDVTFECDWLDSREAIARATVIEGVPVLCEEDLWFSKLTKNAEGGQTLAARLALTIPAAALSRLASIGP